MLARTDKLSEQALLSVQIASDTVAGTIALLLSKTRIELLDYTVLILVIWKIAVTFTLFYIISEGWPGFEQYDVKQLHDSIGVTYVPMMFVASSNWSIDLTLSTPLLLAA